MVATPSFVQTEVSVRTPLSGQTGVSKPLLIVTADIGGHFRGDSRAPLGCLVITSKVAADIGGQFEMFPRLPKKLSQKND